MSQIVRLPAQLPPHMFLLFSYYSLNQIEDGVPMFSKKVMHLGGLEKMLNALAFHLCVLL